MTPIPKLNPEVRQTLALNELHRRYVETSEMALGSLDLISNVGGIHSELVETEARVTSLLGGNPTYGAGSIGMYIGHAGNILNAATNILDVFRALERDRAAGRSNDPDTMLTIAQGVAQTSASAIAATTTLSFLYGVGAAGALPALGAGIAAIGAGWVVGRGFEAVRHWLFKPSVEAR